MAYVLFFIAKFLVLMAGMGYAWTHGQTIPDLMPWSAFACLPLAAIFGALSPSNTRK